MVKSKIFIAVIMLECLTITAMLVHGQLRYRFEDKDVLMAKQHLVAELGLTDFAIWTEARYTRHPSQADFFSAFQDFPGALEHFPAGSIIAPPLQFQGESE
jgi:hypothetical protein